MSDKMVKVYNYVKGCGYLFDLGITISRRDGKSMDVAGLKKTPDGTVDADPRVDAIGEQIDGITSDGGMTCCQIIEDDALWIQGTFYASADNPLLLSASAEILGFVEKQFPYTEYDVQIEWAEIDGDGEQAFEPFLIVTTSDNRAVV